MRVTTRDDQRQHWETQIVISLAALLEQNSMNVAFEMVYSDERLIESERERLGIADAHEQCARQPRTLRHRHGVDRLISLSGIGKRLANDRHNRAQMLPRRQLWHDSAIRLVRGDLR